MGDRAKPGPLIALTLGCTVAAAIFGFGAQVYAWKRIYAGDVGREQLNLLMRLLVFLVLTVILVFRAGDAGSWRQSACWSGDARGVGAFPAGP